MTGISDVLARCGRTVIEYLLVWCIKWVSKSSSHRSIPAVDYHAIVGYNGIEDINILVKLYAACQDSILLATYSHDSCRIGPCCNVARKIRTCSYRFNLRNTKQVLADLRLKTFRWSQRGLSCPLGRSHFLLSQLPCPR